MIETLRRKPYSISDERVLAAMRRVPRHEFVPDAWKHAAYDDRALPIGRDQTISQPYIVAFMTQQLLAGLASPEDARVLEIGTGCGYQTAVLAELVGSVFSIEIIESLIDNAKNSLCKIGYTNIELKHGDGSLGWPENAPFDGALLTCAPFELPDGLISQIKPGGRLIYPVGDLDHQKLVSLTRKEGKPESETHFPVRFVPMTRELR